MVDRLKLRCALVSPTETLKKLVDGRFLDRSELDWYTWLDRHLLWHNRGDRHHWGNGVVADLAAHSVATHRVEAGL